MKSACCNTGISIKSNFGGSKLIIYCGKCRMPCSVIEKKVNVKIKQEEVMEIQEEKLDKLLKCICVKPKDADGPVRDLNKIEIHYTKQALKNEGVKIIVPDYLALAKELNYLIPVEGHNQCIKRKDRIIDLLFKHIAQLQKQIKEKK